MIRTHNPLDTWRTGPAPDLRMTAPYQYGDSPVQCRESAVGWDSLAPSPIDSIKAGVRRCAAAWSFAGSGQSLVYGEGRGLSTWPSYHCGNSPLADSAELIFSLFHTVILDDDHWLARNVVVDWTSTVVRNSPFWSWKFRSREARGNSCSHLIQSSRLHSLARVHVRACVCVCACAGRLVCFYIKCKSRRFVCRYIAEKKNLRMSNKSFDSQQRT